MAVTYWITKRIRVTAPCLILPFSPSTQISQVWNLSNYCYSSLFISCSHLIHTRDNEELQLHYPACARDLLGLSIQMYLCNTQLSSLSPIFSSRQRIWLSTLDYNDAHTACGENFSRTVSSDMIYFLTIVPFISRRDETTSLWNWKRSIETSSQFAPRSPAANPVSCYLERQTTQRERGHFKIERVLCASAPSRH